ncbi:helix-turn-helix transcriptional regulator [Luteimonas sp. SJ-92]|uniref:Helix-turn-helix transcriptional regulator n=1 Tax=Luteimonas salinisoli TaxID=2752307 RepID=A0A853JB21_9GAMM|nr:helix-turn-helix transcriptional regulator [Luteimonas salinisoli]NZA25849.1 helix-turn-helix transcriptional regulator [Luteimonas salinisoli]
MHQTLWADRGQLLSCSADAGAAATGATRIGLSRLGGAKAPAGSLSIWIQLRGSGWLESREGRFRLGRGEWMAFERDSAPSLQMDAHGLCIGLDIAEGTLATLERLADSALYAGRGRLSRRDARIALRLWRTAGGDDHDAVRPLLLHLVAIQGELAAGVRRCPGRSRSRKRQVFGRMQRARLYLEGNSDRVVRIGELADLTNFSSWYFSKAFQSLYDESPQALSARLRLERAAELLRSTSMMIGEVAAASGFDNCCSFARAFRARFGTSATRYREQAACGPGRVPAVGATRRRGGRAAP